MTTGLRSTGSASQAVLSRAEQLDALDAILPFDRRNQLAALLTDDVATLKRLAQSCWYVTGDMDYALLVAVRNLEEYNTFIECLMGQQALVRKYKTVKHGLGLSILE
jgi:DNA-binding Lrp family transcriptional regulator